ncbi:protein kinase domain-containing protein [Corallococcus silvisoli]|uniref:protein kinase domain-containing protein n=1 Tax=Corallococcus silvisoli TaxID=2697031 RepID=UPI001377BEFB|nr:protein kinase [Corallococcus silvisoli]NBD12862.1 protein kinase [Corallococcus silvisoli]
MAGTTLTLTPDGFRGRVLGKYEVLCRLSTGGMAEIFLAAQKGLAGFRKMVVLKQILPDIRGEEEFVRMFLDEAKVTAAFNHPHIAHVYDLDVADGELFLAMEFVPGATLVEVARACRSAHEPIPMGLSLMAVRDTAVALNYAHSFTDPLGRPSPVVHRDVAEKNIMVTYEGVTKLLDFGIAKSLARAGRTAVGMVKGTSGYMSPEQIMGDPLDARSDLFSLGVVLHECLTGMRLFYAKSADAMMNAVLSGEVPPPSRVNKEVPPELDAIVLKALAKRREDRYGTTLEFARAIERAVGPRIWHPEQSSELMLRLFSERRDQTRLLLMSGQSTGDGTSSETQVAQVLARGVDVPEPVVAPPAGALPQISSTLPPRSPAAAPPARAPAPAKASAPPAPVRRNTTEELAVRKPTAATPPSRRVAPPVETPRPPPTDSLSANPDDSEPGVRTQPALPPVVLDASLRITASNVATAPGYIEGETILTPLSRVGAQPPVDPKARLSKEPPVFVPPPDEPRARSGRETPSEDARSRSARDAANGGAEDSRSRSGRDATHGASEDSRPRPPREALNASEDARARSTRDAANSGAEDSRLRSHRDAANGATDDARGRSARDAANGATDDPRGRSARDANASTDDSRGRPARDANASTDDVRGRSARDANASTDDARGRSARDANASTDDARGRSARDTNTSTDDSRARSARDANASTDDSRGRPARDAANGATDDARGRSTRDANASTDDARGRSTRDANASTDDARGRSARDANASTDDARGRSARDANPSTDDSRARSARDAANGSASADDSRPRPSRSSTLDSVRVTQPHNPPQALLNDSETAISRVPALPREEAPENTPAVRRSPSSRRKQSSPPARASAARASTRSTEPHDFLTDSDAPTPRRGRGGLIAAGVALLGIAGLGTTVALGLDGGRFAALWDSVLARPPATKSSTTSPPPSAPLEAQKALPAEPPAPKPSTELADTVPPTNPPPDDAAPAEDTPPPDDSQVAKGKTRAPVRKTKRDASDTPAPVRKPRTPSEDAPEVATPTPAEDTSEPAAAQGFLTLVTEPSARVSLGNRSLGETPLTKVALPVGRHTLKLMDGTGRPLKLLVEIKPDDTTSVRVPLELLANP